MTEVKQHDETKKYWSKVRDFNLSRTNIWFLLLWQLLETIIPFLLIWLFLSPDFQQTSFNYFLTLGSNGTWIFVTASLLLILWAFFFNISTFFSHWQKADSFTFTTGFVFVFLMILLNSLWQYQWQARLDLKIFIRFIISLLALVPGMFLGLVLTSLFRNLNYKKEEDEEAMLLAYRDGQEVPTKQRLKYERALKNKVKRDSQVQELAEFRQQLDSKLSTAYDEHREKYLAKEAKLDAKENKKRQKDALKKAKKK